MRRGYAACAGCGDPVRRTSSAEPRCRRCAVDAGVFVAAALARDYGSAACLGCGAEFVRQSPQHARCDQCAIARMRALEAERGRHLSPAAAAERLALRRRRYGADHRRARQAWAAELDAAGVLPCCLCGGDVVAGSSWHLDHEPGTDDQYRGIAHDRCNSADGGQRGAEAVRVQARARRATGS